MRKLLRLRFGAGAAPRTASAGHGHDEIRMLPFERVQHAALAISFMTLVWTGFALKYPDQWWARPLLLMEGKVSVRSLIHRIAASVFIAISVTHLVSLIVNRKLRKHWKEMLPNTNDPREALSNFAYNLGLGDRQPYRSPHSYIEKAEYWAVVWGAIVMIATGSLLWANNLAMKFLPKIWLDVATSIHFYEARAGDSCHRGLALLRDHLRSGRIPTEHRVPHRPPYQKQSTQRALTHRRALKGAGFPGENRGRLNYTQAHDAEFICPKGTGVVIPVRTSLQQLDQPGRGRDRYDRDHFLAVPPADYDARPGPKPVHGNSGLPHHSRSILWRPAHDPAGHLVEETARRPNRHPGATGSAHLGKPRTAQTRLFRRRHHCGQHRHRQPVVLWRGELHGFGDLLRADLSHRDAARVHGLPELAALARRVREMPHRTRRRLVCQKQTERPRAGLRGDLQHLSRVPSPPRSTTCVRREIPAKPATGPRNMAKTGWT